MASEKRLSGSDAVIYRMDKSTLKSGDGTATFAGATGLTATHFHVMIAAKASSGSVFPAAYTVGDIYYVNDATDVPISGDNYYYFTENTACDAKGFTYSAGKDKVDITTLCDKIKSYRMTKVEITGSFSAIYTTGGTAGAMGGRHDFISNFINVLYYDGTSTYTKTEVNDTLLWVVIYLDEETTAGNVSSALFLPIRLEGTSIDVSTDSATEVAYDFTVIGDEYPQLVESVVPA